MGDLVEGIGDEVLLFVTFLAISLVFLFYVSFLRGRREPAQHQEPQGPPDAPSPVPPPAREEPAVPDQDQARESTGPHDGLRHRPRPNVSASDENPASEDAPRDSSRERGRGSTTPTTAEPDAGEITIRLIQAGGPERTQEVSVSPDTTLDHLRRTYYRAEVSEFRPVKFIYQGRVLTNDTTTLRDLNLTNGGAMHVHVGRPRPQGAPPPNQDQPEVLDLSQFFVPLFGVILGVVWVCMLLYPYVFTLLSKLFLFLLSTAYVILVYLSTYGR